MALPPLYKYLSVQGASLTLGNRTFRHAKPSDFNDTEDMTIQSIFPEATEAALKVLSENIPDIICKHLDDPPTCHSPMKEMILLLQSTFRVNSNAAKIIKAELKKDGVDDIYDFDHMRSFAENFVSEINEFMQGYRVLCVTTEKTSEKMWSEYAQSHQGIALRIEPNLEKDSKFQLFRPVIYRERRPPFYEDTNSFISDSLFGNQPVLLKAIIDKIIYAKTLKWQDENEYRLVIPTKESEQPWDTLPFHPEEVSELYLGLAMNQQQQDTLIEMARNINPDIAIFRMMRRADGALGDCPI